MLEDHKDPVITLALPTYNEEKNILNVLKKSVRSMDNLKISWEIIVIDNFSNDSTVKIVRKYMKTEQRIRLIVHDKNRFYSGSCSTAFRESGGKYLAIMDSDGQYVASDLEKFVKKLDQGYSFVNGWRSQRNDSSIRFLASFVFNILGKIWLGYPFHDLNCGLRMFDRKFRDVVNIRHKINMANPEIYLRAKLAGLRISEVEIEHFERIGGESVAWNVSLSKSFQLFQEANKYFSDLSKELH